MGDLPSSHDSFDDAEVRLLPDNEARLIPGSSTRMHMITRIPRTDIPTAQRTRLRNPMVSPPPYPLSLLTLRSDIRGTSSEGPSAAGRTAG